MRMGISKLALSLTGEKPVRYEACQRKAFNHLGGWYEGVPGHGQVATFLREAAPAKAGKASGSRFSQTPRHVFFQHSPLFNDDHR